MRDWDKIENFPKEQVEKMIKFDDWDKDTSNRLNEIAQAQKQDTNNQQVSSNQQQSNNTPLINTQAQKQDGSDFKTDSSAGDINQGTKGLVDTMKLAEIKKSQNNQPVEQVKEK